MFSCTAVLHPDSIKLILSLLTAANFVSLRTASRPTCRHVARKGGVPWGAPEIVFAPLRSLMTTERLISRWLIPFEKRPCVNYRSIESVHSHISTTLKTEDYCNCRMRRNFCTLTDCQFCMLLELSVFFEKKLLKFRPEIKLTRYSYWIIHWNR